jgi:zinc protease
MPRLSRLLAAALMAGGVIAASTHSSSAASRPPKLQYQISTLPNGLTVVLSEDHSTPIVHLQLVYHVGSKNEKAGRTGFAHLFEHLMFKGSKNVQPEAHTSMLASVGGQSNAYTTDDETVFWETCRAVRRSSCGSSRPHGQPPDDKDTFTNERDVVKEERRMRVTTSRTAA